LVGRRHRCAELTPLLFLTNAVPRFSNRLISDSTVQVRITRFAEKCEQPMMTYLTLAAMLALVLFPLLIPATITAVHAVRRWQPTLSLARTAGYPRRMAPRRLAVPAAA
jgi:hypothetical protein